MSDDVPCLLEKVGRALVVYAEGLGCDHFESKSYEWDLAMLKGVFEGWGLPASGPAFEGLHSKLQAVWGQQDESAPTKVRRAKL